MGSNIETGQFPGLAQPNQPEELHKLYEVAMAKGHEAMNWYAERKSTKKFWGRTFRIWAILFGALATLTPILVQVLFVEPATQQRYSLLASVFAVVGAMLVGLDNFLGASSGWMRYVAAYQALSARVELLQVAWAREALSPRMPMLDAQREVLLSLLQNFLADVHAIIDRETQEWVAEFKGNLLLLEKRMEEKRLRGEAVTAPPPLPAGARSEAASVSEKFTGALSVEVANAGALKGGAWKVHVGTKGVLEGRGGTPRVLVGLAPGDYPLRLQAEKDGEAYVSESVVTVYAGETAHHRFQVE